MADEATAGLDVEILVADPDLPEGDPDDAAAVPTRHSTTLRWLFYSSGTTADPKGAKHSDRSLSAANDGMQWSHARSPTTDKAAVVFPITHVGGLVWLFNTMQTGVELLMVETFNPPRRHRLARPATAAPAPARARCSGSPTSPPSDSCPTATRLLPDVRIFNGGGAPKPATLHAEMMAAFGAPLIGGWGLTESPINTMVHVDDPDEQEGAPPTAGRARASSCAS